MSIAAIIKYAVYMKDGHGEHKDPVVRLELSGDDKGQSHLYVINPPENTKAFCKSVIGLNIWGGSENILIGQKIWADRIGYTQIKLREKLVLEPAIAN